MLITILIIIWILLFFIWTNSVNNGNKQIAEKIERNQKILLELNVIIKRIREKYNRKEFDTEMDNYILEYNEKYLTNFSLSYVQFICAPVS